ncbi:unnamed protein product [Brassica napus]|uniref:(rape) hypothetical protein n=1 Tax=Brassica napus TaxID=3708 RepID=A0A816S1R3_BRANA|nr:unnamed protein product [Brassica napus]
MDRLSQFPDDILIKILSFVRTKDDVAMSILSKGWLSLWTLVPRVIFDDFSEEDNDEDEEGNENHAIRSLSQFVSGTLLLHKAAVLKFFHLNIVLLISNCPVLQELVVEICHQQNVVTFTVDLPSLKNFSVGNTIQENPPDDHLFVIRSQSLKRLRIVDYFGQLDLIGILPKLFDANFNLFPTMPMFCSILPSSCILKYA